LKRITGIKEGVGMFRIWYGPLHVISKIGSVHTAIRWTTSLSSFSFHAARNFISKRPTYLAPLPQDDIEISFIFGRGTRILSETISDATLYRVVICDSQRNTASF